MSATTASTLRYLEKIAEKVKRDITRIGAKLSNKLKYFLVKTVRFGNKNEAWIIRTTERVTRKLGLLQKSLYESTTLSSLFIGVLFTLAFLVLALYYIVYLR
ncbi:MAG: hypothetical protein J7K21_05195 [Desulfurococcales archaeon]|nr:hypothetical protein [Desulfurococcales archaeon]